MNRETAASAFDRSIETMRATAKWTAGAAGAVGVVLVAGLQLSNLGQFSYDEIRLWIGVVAFAVALAAVASSIRFVIAVESAGEVDLGSLAAEETSGDSPLLAFIALNPALLGGFPSIASLNEAFNHAVQKRHQAIWSGSQLEIDWYEQQIQHLGLSIVLPLLSAARYHRVRTTFDQWAAKVVWLGATAGLAIGVFAWATNPA